MLGSYGILNMTSSSKFAIKHNKGLSFEWVSIFFKNGSSLGLGLGFQMPSDFKYNIFYFSSLVGW